VKISFYMEDGLEQIVLTPVNEPEQKLLDRIHAEDRELEIKRGSFFDCQGGWKRHGIHYQTSAYGGSSLNDESTILVLRPKPAEQK